MDTKKRYTLEYADGYYIAMDGKGVIDLADPHDKEFAELVCRRMNGTAPNYVTVMDVAVAALSVASILLGAALGVIANHFKAEWFAWMW